MEINRNAFAREVFLDQNRTLAMTELQTNNNNNDQLMRLPEKENFKKSPIASPARRRKLSWVGLKDQVVAAHISATTSVSSPSSRRRKISRAGVRVAEMVRSISANNIQVIQQCSRFFVIWFYDAGCSQLRYFF